MAPVQKQLVDLLEARDFLALESVSKDVRAAIQHGTSSVYNIDLRLKKFFQDPKAFRRMQAQTGVLIGGDFARAFFNTTTASVNKLHVYCGYPGCSKYGSGVAALKNYLTADGWHDSGKAVPTVRWWEEDYWTPFAIYEKTVKGELVSVNIYHHLVCPLAPIMETAPSTASLNFVTASKAYALVPQETFVEKNAYVTQNHEAETYGTLCRSHLNELAEQGMTTFGLHWDDETGDDDSIVLKRLRRIGDKHTWTIPLDTSDIDIDESYSAAIEQSTFRIQKFEGSIESRGRVDRYKVNLCYAFCHAIFKHAYITVTHTPSGCEYIDKIKALSEKMDGLTMLELSKLPDQDRSNDINISLLEDVHDGIGDFDWKANPVPRTWTYFDQKLVKQLDKLWKEHEREQAKKVAYKNNAHN